MTTRGKRLRSLSLKRHLGSATQPELTEFLGFWSPHKKPGNGRTQLAEKLRRLMSDENVVYGKVDLLSEKVRAVLMALLRKTHYTCDLSGLFRGMDGLEMEYYEGEAALTALARRGFVRISRAHDGLHHGRSTYSIPKEMALAMRGLAGADRRPFDRVFVHAGYAPSSIEAAGDEGTGAVPECATDAVASLDDDLRGIATTVLERFGGILSRHEFGQVFGPHWQSARFLQEFSSRGLGTVGHLDLRGRGIGVEDEALFFFHEVVERYLAEWRARPLAYDLVSSAHGDLMSDARATLGLVKEMAVKVSKEGSVYKAAQARTAERLQFPLQPLVDREELADRVYRLVRGLGLVETNGESELVVTGKGEEWIGRPLLQKLEEAYAFVTQDRVRTLRSRHLARVRAILVELLAEGGDFWPQASLALLARNRYLLDLVRDPDAPSHGPLTLRHAALTELGLAAQDLLLRDFFPLGLVEVAIAGKEAVGVRLSGLGRRVLVGEEEEGATERKQPLVVNPDFEVLVLPEGDVDDLLHALDRIAVRVRTGEVVHYRIDRERIERASVEGEPPAAWIAFLKEHSRAALPQNVVYSMESWGNAVRSATLLPGVLFEATDPAVVESICSHPVLKECVEKVLDPTRVFFNEKVMERQIAQELRALGVYLK